MFSLLFSIFALYFLRHNTAKYYRIKPHMANFDSKIDKIVKDDAIKEEK